MSRKFISALSGTYNVHANEIARGMRQQSDPTNGENDSLNVNNSSQNTNYLTGRLSNLSAFITGRSIYTVPETIKCVVHFLDDTEHIFEVDRTAKGDELMDAVFRHLELIEREYFALQFTEIFHTGSNNQQQQRRKFDDTTTTTNESLEGYSPIVYNKWLDPTKKIRKQMRFCQQPYLLHFRVKFYVTEMSRLLEEYTRYHFYLQLRKDILTGRLFESSVIHLSTNTSVDSHDSLMAKLASYVLQSELGDYCEEEHLPGYSNQFQFIPNQTKEFCQKVESLHRLHQGQTPADAELNYLEEAKHLELYGVDLHNAKDYEQQDIKIGVSSNGITVYKNHFTKINMFSWAKIVKISFKRRYFFIQLKHEGTERYDNMIGFNLCSYRACKSLWKSCVEQHTFFRLHTPKPLTKKFFFFFSLGSKFRYSGKTEFQTIEENRKRLTRTERIFIRNNARNATMPASLMNHHHHSHQNNQQPPHHHHHNNCIGQKAAITDAQKHIVNLKLSSIVNDSNNRMNTNINGSTVNNNLNVKFNKQCYHHHRHHSPLSSMESTSESLSSSTSASSLLGNVPITMSTSKKMIVAEDKTVTNVITTTTTGSITNANQVTAITSSNNNNTVLSTATNTQQQKQQQSSGHQNNNNNKKTIIINSNNQTTNISTSHSVFNKKLPITSTTSSSSTSTSSLESSFMPNNNNTDNNKTKNKIINNNSNIENDLNKHNSCDINRTNGQDVNTLITNGKPTTTVSSGKNSDTSNHTTIITIGANSGVQLSSNTTIMEQTKICSIPSTFQAAYTPSSLISLPYIDSISTASDKTSNSLTNCNGTCDSQTPTITEDFAKDDAGCKQSKQLFDYDSPIRELIQELYDDAAATNSGNISDPNISSDVDSPVHVVTVTMKPDRNGPFGFNVKGGHDQNCPVLVSRVAPNTPADKATPNKLHEGDQVLAINGVEVAGLKHEEVVQLIRATKDMGPEAQLVLSIRPNVYYKSCEHECNSNNGDGIDVGNISKGEKTTVHYTSSVFSSDQPPPPPPFAPSIIDFISINDNAHDSDDEYDAEEEEDDDVADQTDKDSSVQVVVESPETLLETSMNLLKEGLQEDLLILQFEYLPRRNDDEPITVARYLDNVPKNRYLDIAPYDSTRVILKECNTGDYINASYVTMKVEASGVVNRFIATQGPLKRTTSDFWQMVWEQRSTLIVMVTPLIEDGRKKCFKYWPDEGQTMVVNDLLDLTLVDCQDCGAFLERRFKMIDPENKDTHYVTHLQYLAWPDQGVPDDDRDFLKLIVKVRELRAENPDSPVIVHCSAGIGRTGVLILMETGICLIEANQPVYPLELVRVMRNQRAMLIQTSTQFRFVCEALYRVYRDEIVKPLDKFLPQQKPSSSPSNNDDDES